MSRSRIHRPPAAIRKRISLVTAEMAVLLCLGASMTACSVARRAVEIRVSPPLLRPRRRPRPRATLRPAQDEVVAPEDEVSADPPDEPGDDVEHGADIADAPEDEAGTAPTTDPKETSVRGYIMGRTRSRWTDDEDDHDLYGVAAADVETGGEHPWRFHVMGRGSWDRDGVSSEPTFFDLEDTYDGDVQGRLYRAYVDAPLDRWLGLARFGRQILYETPVTAYFDGVLVETKATGPTDLTFGVFGGIPVHHYESSNAGDEVEGAFVTLRPWEQGQLRIDFMHIEDEMRFTDEQNDLLAIGLRHRFGTHLRLEGNYSRLEGENRDVSAKALWSLPEYLLTVRFSHYRLLEAQTDLVNELNPFFNTLSTFHPYEQSQLQITKGIGDWLEVFGGWDFRRIDDEGDIGRYQSNRRLWASPAKSGTARTTTSRPGESTSLAS